MIATKSQGEGASFDVAGNRVGDRLCNSGDITSVQELSDWGILLRTHRGVVAVAVKVDLPLEFLQLVQQAKLDDLERALVNTFLRLWCRWQIDSLSARRGDGF